MKIIMSAMNVIKEMKLFDISIYKLYLFALGLGLAQLVPWFGTVNPLVRVIVAVVLLGYLMTFTYRSREDAKGYFDTVLANFHEYSFMDAMAFELGMVAVGLAIYQYVSWFSTVDTTRYIAIVVFGGAWLMSMRPHQ